jgi:hypothetical protein
METQYWVQIDGGPPYTTDDSGRLWAMLFGVLVGAGEPSLDAHRWATILVDQAVKDEEGHVEKLANGRTLRLTLVRPGEVGE